MQCPNCGGTDIQIQVYNMPYIRNRHHGCMWWLVIGWWWVIIKWVFFTVPALIWRLIRRPRVEVVNRQQTVCVCQDCGHVWPTQTKETVI